LFGIQNEKFTIIAAMFEGAPSMVHSEQGARRTSHNKASPQGARNQWEKSNVPRPHSFTGCYHRQGAIPAGRVQERRRCKPLTEIGRQRTRIPALRFGNFFERGEK